MGASRLIEVIEQRFVRDGNIWSSGGVSAGMDMMLAFIAYTFGMDVAADIQLYLNIFPHPLSTVVPSIDRMYPNTFDRFHSLHLSCPKFR